MTNPVHAKKGDENTETKEPTVPIVGKLLQILFVVGVICAVALVIGFALFLVFDVGTSSVDTCPDYPACSYE